MKNGLRIEIGMDIINYRDLLVPYNLNREISSFLYSILQVSYNDLHDSIIKKDFCFSNIIFNKCKYNKTIELTNNKGLLLVSSIDNNKIESIFTGLNAQKNTLHKIGNVLFFIKYVKKYRDNIELSAEKFKLSLITPIIISDLDHNNKPCFIDISNSNYMNLLSNNISKIIGRTITNNDINISNIKRKALEYKGIKLICYLYDIDIVCSEEEINQIYYQGIGSKTGLGFGMLKIKK